MSTNPTHMLDIFKKHPISNTVTQLTNVIQVSQQIANSSHVNTIMKLHMYANTIHITGNTNTSYTLNCQHEN